LGGGREGTDGVTYAVREGWRRREGGKKSNRPVGPEKHCFACVRIQKSRAQNTNERRARRGESPPGPKVRRRRPARA